MHCITIIYDPPLGGRRGDMFSVFTCVCTVTIVFISQYLLISSEGNMRDNYCRGAVLLTYLQ